MSAASANPVAPGAFAGRVALVTGAASGIGRATALAFARAGASVVLADIDEARGAAVQREAEHLGVRALFVRTDVSSGAAVAALVRTVVERFGALDCAVNNAGVLDVGARKLAADFTEADFDRNIAINLKSVWLCMQREIEQMLKQGTGGRIVNTASIDGLGGATQAALYSAAKAGVLALSKTAALEYARQNIRINALVPGWIHTPMLDGAFTHFAPGNPAGAAADLARAIPAGRMGRPEEAAAAAVWLCSDGASYMIGHSLIVDGGLTATFR